MAYTGVLDDIRTCISLGIPRQTPVFALGELFNARMAGITWAQYTHDVDKMVRCEVESVRRFDYDWVYLNPDDNMEFEPLGVKTKGEGDIPIGAYEFLTPSPETLAGLAIPDFGRHGRMPAYLEATRRIKEELGATVCVTGRVAAPFSSVTLLYGIGPALCLMVDDPSLFVETAAFLGELMIEFGRAQIAAGADAVWVGDCSAGSGFISPLQYREFAQPGARMVNEALKEDGIVMYHAGESSLPHLTLMAETNPDILSIGGKIPIAAAKELVGRRVCVMGNIRGIELLQRGTPEEVERETAAIMEAGKAGGGYIFNSEEGIPRETPEENIVRMMRAAREHGGP